MAVRDTTIQYVYGIGDNLLQLPPAPIVARRDPTTSDFGQPGQVWVNTDDQTIWMLGGIGANSATWQTSPASGVGIFTSVQVTPGDLDVDLGDATIAAGNLEVTVGNATIGGDLTVSGTTTLAGDIDFSSAFLIDLTSSLNAAPSILLHADGGVLEQVKLHSDQGTSATSILLLSDVGGITLSAALNATTDAINLSAPAGGIDWDSGLQSNIASSQAAADAIVIEASAATGGIKIRAGTGGIAIADQADTTPIGIGNIAPSTSRTTTISGGTVVTAAVTDTLNLGTGGATTNANSIKTVNLGSGNVTTGENNINIGSGTAASGTHAINIGTGTGGGTKTVTIGNADGLTSVIMDGPLTVNDSVNQQINFLTGTATGGFLVGNALAGAIELTSGDTVTLNAVNGIGIYNTGVAPIDIDSSDNVQITSTYDNPACITITSNGGVTETIEIVAVQGTNAGAISLESTVGGIQVAAGTSMEIDAATTLQINSSGGAISVGNDAVAQAINIGTGAAARPITIGNVTTSTSVNVNTGTGGFNVATTGTGDIVLNSDDTMLLDADGVLELNSSAGAISIGNDADAQAINIGSAGVRPILIGNSTAGTTLQLNAPTAVGVNLMGLVRFMAGAGSPNTVVTAPAGSLYLRTDPAGATSRLYINSDSATAWVNITCAA